MLLDFLCRMMIGAAGIGAFAFVVFGLSLLADWLDDNKRGWIVFFVVSGLLLAWGIGNSLCAVLGMCGL